MTKVLISFLTCTSSPLIEILVHIFLLPLQSTIISFVLFTCCLEVRKIAVLDFSCSAAVWLHLVVVKELKKSPPLSHLVSGSMIQFVSSCSVIMLWKKEMWMENIHLISKHSKSSYGLIFSPQMKLGSYSKFPLTFELKTHFTGSNKSVLIL